MKTFFEEQNGNENNDVEKANAQGDKPASSGELCSSEKRAG